MAELSFYQNYAAAETAWSEADKIEYRGVERDLAFRMDAYTFVMLLETFHRTTRDERFEGAVIALQDCGIVQDYQWTSKTPFPFLQGIERQFETKAIGLVRLMIDEGVTLRLALANAAANLRWPGNSFAAAVKALERLYRAETERAE